MAAGASVGGVLNRPNRHYLSGTTSVVMNRVTAAKTGPRTRWASHSSARFLIR